MMSLVVVGSLAYDGIETSCGNRERMLGGSCTYICLSASYFTKVSLVGVVGDDFGQEDVQFLVGRGINLDGLEYVAGKTMYWSGVYSEDMNDRTTLRTDLNVFADFQPKLPESYLASPNLFLGNIQPALQRQVREQMRDARLVAGDTMDLWIQTTREGLLETIADWDVLLINDSEARMLSGERNLKRAARCIHAMGPRTLVIKRGEYGAILFHDDYHFLAPGYLLEEVHDPTGAGDSFAGGFAGYLAERAIDIRSTRVDTRELARAVICGSVMGSFCCEQFGVDRFRTLTRDQIDDRIQEFQRITQF